MDSSLELPLPSKAPCPSKYEETIDEDGHIVVANVSRGSLVSEKKNALYNDEFSKYNDEDNDEYCPICYELFVVPPSPSIATKSTHEERFDYDTNDSEEEDVSDFSIDNKIEIEIEIGADKHRHCPPTHSHPPLTTTNKSCHVEYQTKRICPINSKEHQKISDHNRIRCHPREKVAIPGCGHEFCRECLKEHCSYAISIRDLPIRCPKCSGDDCSAPCSAILPTEIVRESLMLQDATNPDWIKFYRLQRMMADPSLISCTRCDELISPKEQGNNSSDDPNRIHCPSCQHVFCRIHGDAHLGRNCIEANRSRDEMDPSELAILELCKPCSHCGVPICKEKGCNHVVCPVCKEDMCFNCGTHEHLENKGRTVRTCKNCNGSYFDHRYLWRHRLGVLAKLPFMLPIYVGYMVMSLTLATVTCGCFCCLGCGVRYTETKTKTKRETNAKQGLPNGSKKIVWMPRMALREVLGWLLLPFIDLFRNCRFPCCFCHNAPGLCKGRPADDDEYDDDFYRDNVEEDHSIESDIENQIGES